MEQLEQIIGYTFQNKKLLRQALTHSSYANEKKLGKLGCNERLEFLGDAVLELISSDFLYKKFPQIPEGELTKKRAIYLDGGFSNAKKFVLNFILNDIEHKQLFYDSKTILQELVQEKGLQPIEYVLTGEEGPDHDKCFTVVVQVNGQVVGNGTGHTKKAAEQAAAYQAIQEKKF